MYTGLGFVQRQALWTLKMNLQLLQERLLLYQVSDHQLLKNLLHGVNHSIVVCYKRRKIIILHYASMLFQSPVIWFMK